MFFVDGIFGNDLPDKTICLTFDDGPGKTEELSGPGPRTLELARFVAESKITATFFVIGERAAKDRDIVRAWRNWIN
jgi:peptidoglycan/xylan/chitin deacetylase (PgdA/CDA1 family)